MGSYTRPKNRSLRSSKTGSPWTWVSQARRPQPNLKKHPSTGSLWRPGPPPCNQRRRRTRASATHSDSRLYRLSSFKVGKTQVGVQRAPPSFSRISRLVGKMTTRSLSLDYNPPITESSRHRLLSNLAQKIGLKNIICAKPTAPPTTIRSTTETSEYANSTLETLTPRKSSCLWNSQTRRHGFTRGWQPPP